MFDRFLKTPLSLVWIKAKLQVRKIAPAEIFFLKAVNYLSQKILDSRVFYKQRFFANKSDVKFTAQKQFPADLVIFTKEINNEKIHFLCGDYS